METLKSERRCQGRVVHSTYRPVAQQNSCMEYTCYGFQYVLDISLYERAPMQIVYLYRLYADWFDTPLRFAAQSSEWLYALYAACVAYALMGGSADVNEETLASPSPTRTLTNAPGIVAS